MNEYKISQDAFKAWLGTNFRTVVGRAVRSSDCPLVNYIKTIESPAAKDDIHTGGLEIVIGHRRSLLPGWAKLFILEVDAHKNYSDPITGQVALGFLEAVDGKH